MIFIFGSHSPIGELNFINQFNDKILYHYFILL